jgi:3-dehydroquinate synthase
LPVSEVLTIQSHKGPYSVVFDDGLLANSARILDAQSHFLVDANVASLYGERLRLVLDHPHALVIEATEENKSIERVIPVIERLLANKVRRDHALVAIGGGILQDITCFVASILLRGIPWKSVPTTLLAQADSCIGSKSSINIDRTKNSLGTFNPPEEVIVCSDFLSTLENRDIRSGLGEILKVHAIDSPAAYDRLAADYDALWGDRGLLLAYVRQALLIKQRFIEADEFDRGVRNVLNYGHSFGHAIESATDYAVPHGIAVTMGMDLANRIAVVRGLLPERHHQRMQPVLYKNYAPFADTAIPVEAMLTAFMRDKKNTAEKLVVILPIGEEARMQRVEIAPDEVFRDECRSFLDEMMA